MLVILSREAASRAPFTLCVGAELYRVFRLFGRLGWRRRTFVDDEAADC